MAQPRHQRLAALLVLLSLCCLSRLAGAATAACAASSACRQDGAATATVKPAGQEAARGFTAEGELPARILMEVDVEDYPGSAANDRHDQGHDVPGPRGPRHP